MSTDHITVVLTRREAEQVAGGKPDARAWRSIRRKCNKAVIAHDEAVSAQLLYYELLTEHQAALAARQHELLDEHGIEH